MSSLFYCLIYSTDTEIWCPHFKVFGGAHERQSQWLSLRCLFKSLCLSHPSQLTLNQSNQITKNPQGPLLSDGGVPHPFLSLRDGYRLRAIKAFVGLLRWKPLFLQYNGKELESVTCTTLKVLSAELLTHQPSHMANIVQVVTLAQIVLNPSEWKKMQRSRI